MITKEMLQMFCRIEKGNISQPFNSGAYTYASNGHFAIRIPAMTEFAENKGPVNIDQLWFHGTVADNLWCDIPKTIDEKSMKECPDCNGTGKNLECPDCDGSGEVGWTSEHGFEYEAKCQMCDGTGRVRGNSEICLNCDGHGKIAEKKLIDVGTKLLDANLLYVMSRLPDCQIATEAVEGYAGIPFRFDGGDGIIMPCRRFGGDETK